MTLPELAIKRNVMAWMIGFVFILFGVIGYTRIAVQKMPDASLPVVTITIKLPGGSPDTINQSITRRVEESMNQISGVKSIDSVSEIGKSQVQVNFVYGQDMNLAVAQVQSQLNLISDLFPSNTKPAVIEFSSIASRPIMLIAFFGSDSISGLSDFIYDNVLKRIEGVDGVANAEVVGIGQKNIHVVLDLAAMARMNVTVNEVTQAFQSHHVNVPGGYIKNNLSRFILNFDAEYHSAEAFQKMVVAYRDKGPVYLGDVAQITYDSGENSGQALFDGKPAIGITVVKKPVANTVNIGNTIYYDILLKEVQPLLPPGVKFDVIYEDVTSIEKSAHELERDAWLSIITAGIIIFIFLMSVRATFIVATAIPVSLLGVVAVMYFTDYTFNIITLLGIILLVGVVVDDAIIVLENIFRHMHESNKTAKEVAIEASNQVVFAVLASTLTLIAIFLPVIFLQGEISLYLKAFAIVVTSGVLISLLVSLTLTPMLCASFLKHENHQIRLLDKISAFITRCEFFYKRQLNNSLNKPKIVLIMFVGLIMLAIPAYIFINKEFIPAETREGVFRIQINTPVGSSNEYVQGRVAALVDVVKKAPEVKGYFSTVTDGGEGTLAVGLVPAADRKRSQEEVVADIAKRMQSIPGAIYSLDSDDQGKRVTFQLRGPDLQKVIVLSRQLLSKLNAVPDLTPVYVEVGDEHPGYEIKLNRDLLSKYKLSSREVLDAFSSVSTDGLIMGYFNKDTATPRTEINLRVKDGDFAGIEDLHKIMIRNRDDKLISLDTVATLVPTLSLARISRSDLNYSINFSAIPKASLSKAITLIESSANDLPKGYYLAMTGDAVSLQETMQQMALAVSLILILIYIVLASQFNSFIQPVIVMIAIPLAIIGGLILLWVSGQSLNIYSMIGMLLLMGLVAKNSILLIDLTNHLRLSGKSIRDSLMEACPIRMRPVVMTSLAIISALLPAAILGGASPHRGLSVVIIGGMISSTILSLIMVPVAYLLIESFLEKRRQAKSSPQTAKLAIESDNQDNVFYDTDN